MRASGAAGVDGRMARDDVLASIYEIAEVPEFDFTGIIILTIWYNSICIYMVELNQRVSK